MNPKSKLLSLLLVISLIAGLMPTAALAADGDKTIMLGTSGIKDPTAEGSTYYTPSSYIYFGMNGETPIKWRVLDADKANDSSTDGMFLLSEYLLENTQFHDNSNAWQGSTAQNWCKTFASNTSNFSVAEQSAMLGITKTDSAENSLYSLSWGESSLTADDKMFFLSVRELADYVGSYDGAPGLTATTVDGSAGVWWLRSPDADGTYGAGAVGDTGIVAYDYVAYDWAARPAFNLDLTSVLFTSAAAGGKIPAAGSGGNQGGEAADAIFEIGDYDGSEWKLTLLDNNRIFAVTEEAASGKPGDTITLNYAGATTGTNEYISVIIADSSGAQYYGRVAQPDTDSGTVNVTIPTGLTDGTYTLYVFSEQYNGGEQDDTKLTDYASAFETVALTVSSDTTAPTLTSGSATRDSDTTATVKFTSSEAGTYYYAVVESGETEPTINTTGAGTACAAGENTIFLTSLSGAGAKDIYIVAKDAVGNVSDKLKITIPAIYTLTVNLNGGSGGTTGGEYTAGEVVSINAGSKAGYRFAGWTASGGGTFADPSSASTTFTMPAADTTITANWTAVPSGPSTYQVTIDSDITGGIVTASPRWAARGDTVYLTVTPDEGYELSTLGVSDRNGDALDLDNEGSGVYSFTMPIGRVTVTATFDKAVITLPFTDVSDGDWFYEPVCFVYENGLMTGTSATTFEPNTPLSRAMLVAILHRLEGSPAASGSDFTDVANGDWYAEAVNWAASVGVVNGFDDGSFQPNTAITREQMAAILRNYAQYKGLDVSASGDLSAYSDAASVSSWAEDSVAWAVREGLLSGMTEDTLQPQGLSTRAQVAAVLQRYLEN